MSKIGEVNLDLQDQANSLGYSTVAEALDDGYVVVYNAMDDVVLMSQIDYQHLQAHREWLHRKTMLINKLSLVAATLENEAAAQVIEEAIDFIKEGEV